MEDKEIFLKWEEFKKILLNTKRKGIDNVIKWLDETDFKVAPASTQYHASYKGGLLEHSLQVYYHMYDFPNLIQYFDSLLIKSDSIYLVRQFEIYICFIDYTYKNELLNKENNTTWILLKEGVQKICDNFYKYDLLTQLTILETMENNINDEDVRSIINYS